MIEQTLFKTNNVGRDGFIWWIGQVANDSWRENTPGSTPDTVELKDQKGFDARYQVRIMGYHTDDAEELPDLHLPWATVMYPVTAGANAGSSGATPNIRKGNFVYGFFLDGEDAQQPVIMGILGYSQYAQLFKEGKPFVPTVGYTKVGNEADVPSYNIREEEVDPDDLAEKPASKSGEKSISQTNTQGQTGSADTVTNSDKKQDKDGNKKEPIPSTYSCGLARETSGVRLKIQNLIQTIENAKKSVEDTYDDIEEQYKNIDEFINITLKRAAKDLSGDIAKFLTSAFDWIVKKITAALNKIYIWLDPVRSRKVGDVTKVAMDLLTCQFKRILNNLIKMIFNALKSIINRWITVPICAAETIIAAILGKLMGLLNGILNAIMAPIKALFEAIGQALDIVGAVFEFLDAILGFLNCEGEVECPPHEVEEWAIWLGTDPISDKLDAGNIVKKVKEFASTVSDVVDPDNFDFDLDVDFSDVLDISNCYTGANLCGPPRVVFWGGSGSGATGNAIVSAAGEILGVDIINSGTGYDDRPPFISFVDDCGKGRNASGTVNVGPGGEVSDVDMGDSGWGYIPVPDGDLGGDGRIWNPRNNSWTRPPLDQPIPVPVPPGTVISVPTPGTEVHTPPRTITEFVCDSGEIHEVFGGTTFISPCPGTLTAPFLPELPPEVLEEDELRRRVVTDYSVILYICQVSIVSRGYGYEEGDKVVIEPDNGAEIIPTFDSNGSLIDLKIIDGGEGFTEFPVIYIESETGFNAKIRPRLCIDRVTDELNLPDIQDKVVSVVDCVGKV